MTYGNKFIFLVVLLSLFFIGCESKINNFHFDLYDGFTIKAIDNEIKLYKNDELIKIGSDNYKIDEIKYNNDVVCLKLKDGNYYMVYYVDSSVFGPYTKESLDKTIEDDSTLIIDMKYQKITKMDGLIYE